MNTPTARFLDSRDFHRIARAIAWIDEHFREQPRLKDIARAVHLSEFHFNRLFRRWAGVTPRQYLAHLTARAAHRALAQDASVLEATHAVGLSGPSRLHDLMVTLEALSPGELRAGGAGLVLQAGFADTPFGRALLARTPRGLAHLAFVEPGCEAAALEGLRAAWPASTLERDDVVGAGLAAQVFARARGAAPLQLAVPGTRFQLRVWRALLALGPDQVTTYGALARAVGAPRAARAVGNAVGANPVAWLIPCHNVLRGDGSLGGYRYGAGRKRAMHALKGLSAQGPARAAAAPALGAQAT